MNEAQRLAYLEAMDIESFYSRQPLPGAAPSRRVRVVRRSETPAETSAGDAVRQLKSHVPAPAPAVPPAAAVAAQPSADAAIDELPIFSLAVTVAGGCLWLDHLPPGRNPGQDYARLMEAICHALELPADRPEVTLFGFPMAQAPQLGRDINAARDALLGFLERRLEKVSPRAVILLGDLEQPWFNRECLSSRQVISTVSAWRMLRDPGLKATAWSDLKVLLGNAS